MKKQHSKSERLYSIVQKYGNVVVERRSSACNPEVEKFLRKFEKFEAASRKRRLLVR